MAHKFIARLGAVSQTTQKILLYSYDSDAVTVTCTGGSVSVSSWTAIGTDSPGKYPNSTDTTDRACYTAVATITGLTVNTQYSWTASQLDNWGGDFKTLPSVGSEETFSFGVWTCDSKNSGSDGCLDYIEENLNTFGGMRFLIKQDDVGYYDDVVVDDSAGLSGHVVTVSPEASPSEYKYGVAMMVYHHMTSDGEPVGTVRKRLWSKLPSFEMWGDHELCNNYRNSGWTGTTGYHNVRYYKKCRPAWDGFHANGMPDPLTGGTFTLDQTHDEDGGADAVNSGPHPYLYFGVKAGQFAWVQMDRSSHAAYDATYITNNSGASPAPVAQLLGSTQVTALQNFLNTPDCKFKCFASSNSLKRVISGSGIGAQEPWKSPDVAAWATEAQGFIDFVEAQDNLNGTDGSLFMYRGNDHNQQVFDHNLDGAGVKLWELVAGPITHAGNHSVAPVGVVYDNTLPEWNNGNVQGGTHRAGFLHCTVYGSERLRARVVDMYGDVIWQADLFPGSNDFVYPVPQTTVATGGLD